MNKADKIITTILVKEGAYNPYLHKDNWNWFDYLMGYGMPLGIFVCVIMLIFI